MTTAGYVAKAAVVALGKIHLAEATPEATPEATHQEILGALQTLEADARLRRGPLQRQALAQVKRTLAQIAVAIVEHFVGEEVATAVMDYVGELEV